MKSLKQKVISKNNLPYKLPTFETLVTILALDYWDAPQWICGAVGLLFVFLWIGVIVNICNNTTVDIFSDSDDIEKRNEHK